MPPRRKKSQKNDLDRLSLLAGKLGINVDNLLEEVPLTEVGPEAITRHEIEAESVLFYIESKGKGFSAKNCKHCSRAFLHTYQAVNYCSDECRAWALAEFGLIWNYHRRRDADRWNAKGKGYVPKVIGAEATVALIEAGHNYSDIPEQRNED